MNNTVQNIDSSLAAKRHLAQDLKAALALKFDATRMIEGRAVEVFKFSSAIIGVVVGLRISLAGLQTNSFLTVGLLVLLFIYLAHIAFMCLVFAPREYSNFPGFPQKGVLDYAGFHAAYLAGDEAHYLDQVIVDLAGNGEEPGVLEDAEKQNQKKARFFRYLSASFFVMLGLLLILGVGVAVGV